MDSSKLPPQPDGILALCTLLWASAISATTSTPTMIRKERYFEAMCIRIGMPGVEDRNDSMVDVPDGKGERAGAVVSAKSGTMVPLSAAIASAGAITDPATS